MSSVVPLRIHWTVPLLVGSSGTTWWGQTLRARIPVHSSSAYTFAALAVALTRTGWAPSAASAA